MKKKERLFATLAGEHVDRPPVSFWRHFYPEEVTVDGLVSAMLGFQREFDWDFMKVNPRAVYHVEDWGNSYEFSTDPHTNHRLLNCRIKQAADWHQLEPLEPDQGVLGQHLEALRKIGEGLAGEVPFIMTIFNAISIAGRLTETPEMLANQIREAPEAVHAGLKTINETFIRYARACLDAGATGIFYPTTNFATSEMLSLEEYNEFGRAYDLDFLDAVQDAPFLMLHVCKSHCYLHQLLDYPVHAINWSTQDPTTPSLAETGAKTELALVGGVDQGPTVCAETPDGAVQQAREALESMKGHRFILGAGCTVPSQVNSQVLHALREVVETA